MKISRKSSLTGKTHEMDLDVTQKEWRLYLNGMSIEESMPRLTAYEASFVASGITEDEWKEVMKDVVAF